MKVVYTGSSNVYKVNGHSEDPLGCLSYSSMLFFHIYVLLFHSIAVNVFRRYLTLF